jgi:hypothetical protein
MRSGGWASKLHIVSVPFGRRFGKPSLKIIDVSGDDVKDIKVDRSAFNLTSIIYELLNRPAIKDNTTPSFK